jgi:hypothetical protein
MAGRAIVGEDLPSAGESEVEKLRVGANLREVGRLDAHDEAGALPTLIQWEGRHPAQAMADSGLALRSLALRGVPDGAREVLKLRGVDIASDPGPALCAVLDTPLGSVTLTS